MLVFECIRIEARPSRRSLPWNNVSFPPETKAGGIGGMPSKTFSGENLFQNIYAMGLSGGEGPLDTALTGLDGFGHFVQSAALVRNVSRSARLRVCWAANTGMSG